MIIYWLFSRFYPRFLSLIMVAGEAILKSYLRKNVDLMLEDILLATE